MNADPHGGNSAPDGRITLAVLMGPQEGENVVPFLEQFKGWPGDIVVVDDTGGDDGIDRFRRAAREGLGLAEGRLRVTPHPRHGDFSVARNRAHEIAGAKWILHADLDEQWDRELLRAMPDLVAQCEQSGKSVCGFPRANRVEGVLVNDIPPSEWTEAGLKRAAGQVPWPPRNMDIQLRLMRTTERWENAVHEFLRGVQECPGRIMVISDRWIGHNKSLSRQTRQETLYRSILNPSRRTTEESSRGFP